MEQNVDDNILSIILEYCDGNKINFLSTCKNYREKFYENMWFNHNKFINKSGEISEIGDMKIFRLRTQNLQNCKINLQNLTHLVFNGEKLPDNFSKLVPNLQYLKFGNKFNESVDNLPQKLQTLIFGKYFNQKVDNLPQKLQTLIFGSQFNQNVDNLPQNLQTLIFGFWFNQKVDNLPQNLKTLKFGYFFNQNVDNLPQSLQYLKFGFHFNKNVDNLPQNLKTLKFGYQLHIFCNFECIEDYKHIGKKLQ